MGKVQSKHGECYLVNTPLNPLCQPDLDEDSSSLKTVNCASGHKNSSLKLFHYQSDDAMQEQIGLRLDKENTLREVLPSGIASKQSKKEKPKTSEQGRREKEEKISQCINGVSHDLSMEDPVNQEFCFTLYKLKGHKNITVNDTEGLVQAIHDALGNSIELPPSGSRTVKVKLAISPNSASSQEKDDMFHYKDKPRKKPLYAKKMGNVPKENSVNLSSSSPEKESSKPKCRDISSETTNFLRSSSEVKPNICFADEPKFKQGYWSNSLQRRRDSVETGCLDCPSRHGKLYMVECQHKQHRKHHCCYRNHSGEGFGHRDTYWKKNINEKLPHGSFESFSYGTCDKNYLNRQAPNHQEDLDSHCIKKLGTCSYQKSKSYDTSSTIKHSQNLVFSDQKDNLSNVNFDPCDPLSEKKFNWEHKFIQKYPESHGACDHHVGMNSPKVQLKTNSGMKATGPEPQTSQNHHHRNKHREYEKMQTIQQVADQLENTHLGVPSKEDSSGNTQSMFQKYHHFHEHVHYHYYHYLPT